MTRGPGAGAKLAVGCSHIKLPTGARPGLQAPGLVWELGRQPPSATSPCPLEPGVTWVPQGVWLGQGQLSHVVPLALSVWTQFVLRTYMLLALHGVDPAPPSLCPPLSLLRPLLSLLGLCLSL